MYTNRMYNRGGGDIEGPERNWNAAGTGYPEAMRPKSLIDDHYNDREQPPLSWRERQSHVTHDNSFNAPAPRPLLDEGYNDHEQPPLNWRARQSGGPQNIPIDNPTKPLNNRFDDGGEQLSWRGRQVGSAPNQSLNSSGTKPFLDDHLNNDGMASWQGRQNAATRNTPVDAVKPLLDDQYGNKEQQLSWRGRQSGSTNQPLDSSPAKPLFDKGYNNESDQLSWRARQTGSHHPPQCRPLMDDARNDNRLEPHNPPSRDSIIKDPGNLSWRSNERTQPLPSIRTMEEILANVKKVERGFESDGYSLPSMGQNDHRDSPQAGNLSWRTTNVDRRGDDNRNRMDPYSRTPNMARNGNPPNPSIENGRQCNDQPPNLSWRTNDMSRNGNGYESNPHQPSINRYNDGGNHMESGRHPDANMSDQHVINDRLSWRQSNLGAANNDARNPKPLFPNPGDDNHHADSNLSGLSWRSRDQGADPPYRPRGYPP